MHTILQLDDTPHSVALGTAIGMFVGLTPTGGIQMFLVLLVAFFSRPFFYFNRPAALITVYVSNPLTAVPIYYFMYWVGTFFIPGEATSEDFAQVLKYESFASWWESLKSLCLEIGAPLLIGTAIVATIAGLLTYPLMYWLVQRFHVQHPEEIGTDKLPPKVQQKAAPVE